VPNASAETLVFEKSTSVDAFNRPDLNLKYDIQKVVVGMYDTDLDMLHFWVLFAQPLTANLFNDNQGSWAGILIDTNNDDTDDIVINTLARSYTANYGQTASASYRNGSKSCPTTSWMDLDNKTGWLGFKVSQKCLGLGNKFEVQGYADYIATDNASYDYAPDSYEVVDLGDYYSPKPKATLAIPTASSDVAPALSNYSLAPTNLVTLSASLKESVVTVECIVGKNGGTGTAWSAKVNIPIGTYKSFLITNYHVISDCIPRGTVDIILSNNAKYVGQLAAWDPDNDIAGIYLTTFVPPLTWQGEIPVQGSWVGLIGSPKGLPGVLTTGIVSSVSRAETYVTFTAAINPGNSGGPLFDSAGRVMAIATAKVRDSEGFGIGNGVPLICKAVVKCSNTLVGWGSKPDNSAQLANNQRDVADAANSARESIDSYYDAKEICLAVADDFEELSNTLFELTQLTQKCNQYDDRINTIESSLKNLTAKVYSTSAQVFIALDEANIFAEKADEYVASLQDFTDELSNLEVQFDEYSITINKANRLDEDVIETWQALQDTLLILPKSVSLSIKKNPNYLAASKIVAKSNLALQTRDSILSKLESVEQIRDLGTIKLQLISLSVAMPSLTTFKKSMAAVDKLVPQSVCVRGSTVVSATKAGKCARGFESVPTR
jgi:hypothetical protein